MGVQSGDPERDRLWALTRLTVPHPRSQDAPSVLGRPEMATPQTPPASPSQASPAVPAAPPTPATHPAPGVTWIPSRAHPSGESAVPTTPDSATTRVQGSTDGPAPARDAADVAARRSAALAAAGSAYTSRHGHPLTHPRTADESPARRPHRWAVPVRLALTAALALGLLGGAVALRAASAASAGLVPVDLPAVGASLADGTPQTGVDGQGARVDPTAASSTSGGEALVHVVGQVEAPGVVRLPAGSRVIDAILAAGGATSGADLSAVNLARVVTDGEQVVVPAPGASSTGQVGAGSPVQGAVADGSVRPVQQTVDLNVADAAALDTLPGIGPVLAGRIVEWRAAHGRFADVEQLGEVEGIGPTLLTKLRPLVTV